MEKRMISTEFTEEDMPIEAGLRPLTLADYIGQEKVKKNLKVYIEAGRRHLTTAFFTVLRDLERLRLRVLSQMRWGCILR